MWVNSVVQCQYTLSLETQLYLFPHKISWNRIPLWKPVFRGDTWRLRKLAENKRTEKKQCVVLLNPFTVSWSNLHSAVFLSYVAIANNYIMGHFKQRGLLSQRPEAQSPQLSCQCCLAFPRGFREKNQSCPFQLQMAGCWQFWTSSRL